MPQAESCHHPTLPCPGGAPLEDAQEAMKSALLSRCAAAPATGSGDLAPDHIAAAAALLAKTLLQHWALYQLVFTEEQAHELHTQELLVGSVEGV